MFSQLAPPSVVANSPRDVSTQPRVLVAKLSCKVAESVGAKLTPRVAGTPPGSNTLKLKPRSDGAIIHVGPAIVDGTTSNA